jgi:hypothetical protein
MMEKSKRKSVVEEFHYNFAVHLGLIKGIVQSR